MDRIIYLEVIKGADPKERANVLDASDDPTRISKSDPETEKRKEIMNDERAVLEALEKLDPIDYLALRIYFDVSGIPRLHHAKEALKKKIKEEESTTYR